MTIVVPHPGIKLNCISLMSTCCIIKFSIISELSSESDVLISVPYNFLVLKNAFLVVTAYICAKFPFCSDNSHYNLIY